MLWLGACAPKEKTQDRATRFQSIADRIDGGDYVSAGEAARQAWSHETSQQWGWRFKLQYISALLYLQKVDEAGRLLSVPLPGQLVTLEPQYRYLEAYLHYYRHDPAAPSLLKSAIELARVRGDAVTQANGLLLLLAEGEESKPGAEDLANAALTVSRRHHLAFQEAASLTEIGLIYIGQERYAAAMPYLSDGARLARTLHAHYLQVTATANLGESYFSLGDLDRALKSLSQARKLLRETDPSYIRINVNNELGSLESLRQNNALALKYFQEAFRIAAQDTRLSSYAPAANNLAESLIEAGNLDEAEKYNNLAAKALLEQDSPTPGLAGQNDLNRAAIDAARGDLAEAQQNYQKVFDRLKAQPPSFLLWSAYAQRAVLNERLGKMSAAANDFASALDAIETNRSAQKVTDYQITFLSALIRFYQQYVDFLIRQNQPWSALAVADSSRASVLTHGLIASRHQPDFAARLHRQARDSNSALLFYWLAPQASYVWAITPTNDIFKKLDQSKLEIERDVASYSSFIQNQHQDTRASGNPVGLRLYRTLIGSVASVLSPGTQIMVVPDGALHGLNFETLLIPGDKPRYWLEDVTMIVAPNLGVLLTTHQNAGRSERALVIGDPVYSNKEFSALPQSAEEVARVSARFPGSSIRLTQKRAVRAAYAAADPQSFSLIHFSAHMDADAQSPLDSAIILSQSEGGTRLYARDIMAIPLRANLVTFSGCRSVGARALSGEGMVGFAWAAFEAGAQNAVTSLWAVDDSSTVDLMDKFYAGIQAGEVYASSLRRAKLQMLQTRYQRPYYWAPFQLYSRALSGNNRHLVARR